MNTLLGMKVVESPILPTHAPNFVLTPGDYISDEYRAKRQAWCNDFFGMSPFFIIYDPSTIGLPGGPQIAAHPQSMQAVIEKLLTLNR